MLLGISRSKQPYILFIIALLTVFFWFLPEGNRSNDCSLPFMPLTYVFVSFITKYSWVSKIMGLTFVLILLLLITHLNTRFLIISQRSYLPAIFFVTLVLANFSFFDFHPVFVAAIFLILIIEKLIDVYKSDKTSFQIFDAAIYLSLATLFYFPVIFLVPFLFIALAIMKPFNWREWFFIVLGFLLPIYIYYALLYLTDFRVYNVFPELMLFLTKTCNYTFVLSEKIKLYYLIILILFASFYVIQHIGSYKIVIRKTYYLLFVLFVNLLIIYSIIPSVLSELFVLMAIPVAYLLGNYFIETRKNRLKEFLFDMWFIIVIVLFFWHF